MKYPKRHAAQPTAHHVQSIHQKLIAHLNREKTMTKREKAQARALYWDSRVRKPEGFGQMVEDLR